MVRSDVLLHIPRHLRSSWNIDTEYIIFVGIQMGTVVISEIEYVPNLVFPWLDDRSFNKWFQPEGMDRPLGALDIGRADQVDFRGKSFNQLFEFLREKRYLGQDFQQYELQLHDRPNLILCGYTCAGKTTASQHLALGFGYLHIEASDFMHLGYLQRHGFRKSVSISDFAEQALEQKPAIAAEKVADHIEENSAAPVVVSGFRSPEEVWYLKRRLSLRGKEFKTVFIDAPEQIRFERLRKRMRPGDNISLADFCLRDRQQDRMGLGRILSSSSTSVVTNRETLSEFLQKVDRVIEAPRPEDLDVEEALLLVRTLKDIKLEDAILLALLAVWRPDETRPFFTTTQIAALVKATLPRIVPKHKDNVSRYFNQDFYAYYEIDNTSSRTARGYRLSNTGYGRAVRELRRIRSSLLSEEGSSDRDGSLT
jgi:dephospho-CoA kinase